MKLLKSLVVVSLLVASGIAEKVSNMPAPVAYVDDYAGVMTDAGKADRFAYRQEQFQAIAIRDRDILAADRPLVK